MPASVASLDSLAPSDDSYDSDEETRLAQLEWEESLEQLQQLFAMVMVPWFGKWLGRRWSYWAYARYIRLGLGKPFFLGERNLAATTY
ncbi:hypothetical protein PsYK624_018140 [Phanerochaete sordida]|uniref:Uncharacterized protein n=1 Tax=Phanerochaete sordida TaxID=48140 RepID=A0A9P3L857_9APHY|nr:hypothetical protein PsYK624_018140 [Phanerochaete sordida]